MILFIVVTNGHLFVIIRNHKIHSPFSEVNFTATFVIRGCFFFSLGPIKDLQLRLSIEPHMESRLIQRVFIKLLLFVIVGDVIRSRRILRKNHQKAILRSLQISYYPQFIIQVPVLTCIERKIGAKNSMFSRSLLGEKGKMVYVMNRIIESCPEFSSTTQFVVETVQTPSKNRQAKYYLEKLVTH